jgi:Helix-turn-helix domain
MNAADTFVQTSLDELIANPAVYSTLIQQQNPAPAAPARPFAKQLHTVHEAMKNGRWMTLAEIDFYAGCPEASARIRELSRKGIQHEKRRAKNGGLFEYRLIAGPTC